MKIHNFVIVCLLLLVSRANAYFAYVLLRCQYTSTHDVVYVEQAFFNKKLLGEFNSTVGQYVAYTKALQPIAELMNSKKGLKHTVRNRWFCKRKLPIIYDVLSISVAPSVHLRLVKEEDDEHQGTLVCSVYNFHPKKVKVTWLRNGKEEKSNVTFTEELANGNWLYQVNSHLNVKIASQDKISCKVEHISLKNPKILHWDPMPPSAITKIVAGATGLFVGLAFLIAGLVINKMGNNGMGADTNNLSHTLKHQNEAM